jgi:hypothetical protein
MNLSRAFQVADQGRIVEALARNRLCVEVQGDRLLYSDKKFPEGGRFRRLGQLCLPSGTLRVLVACPNRLREAIRYHAARAAG